MTQNPALDATIRPAQHLLFAFDGPIRGTSNVKLNNSATVAAPTSAYLHETLASCIESGRSVAVISASSLNEVREYLDAHDLSTQVAVVAASILEVASLLEASPVDCVLITSSLGDIESAQATGTPSIGYARTFDAATHLVDVGATTSVISLIDLAISLRAYPVISNL